MLNSTKHRIYPTQQQNIYHLTEKQIILINARRPTVNEILTFMIKKRFEKYFLKFLLIQSALKSRPLYRKGKKSKRGITTLKKVFR